MPKTIDEFDFGSSTAGTAGTRFTSPYEHESTSGPLLPSNDIVVAKTKMPYRVAEGAVSTVEPVKASIAMDLIDYDITNEVRHINTLLSEQWTDYERQCTTRRIRPFNPQLSVPAGEAVCRAYRAAGWCVDVHRAIDTFSTVSSVGKVDYFLFSPLGDEA